MQSNVEGRYPKMTSLGRLHWYLSASARMSRLSRTPWRTTTRAILESAGMGAGDLVKGNAYLTRAEDTGLMSRALVGDRCFGEDLFDTVRRQPSQLLRISGRSQFERVQRRRWALIGAPAGSPTHAPLRPCRPST